MRWKWVTFPSFSIAGLKMEFKAGIACLNSDDLTTWFVFLFLYKPLCFQLFMMLMNRGVHSIHQLDTSGWIFVDWVGIFFLSLRLIVFSKSTHIILFYYLYFNFLVWLVLLFRALVLMNLELLNIIYAYHANCNKLLKKGA